MFTVNFEIEVGGLRLAAPTHFSCRPTLAELDAKAWEVVEDDAALQKYLLQSPPLQILERKVATPTGRLTDIRLGSHVSNGATVFIRIGEELSQFTVDMVERGVKEERDLLRIREQAVAAKGTWLALKQNATEYTLSDAEASKQEWQKLLNYLRSPSSPKGPPPPASLVALKAPPPLNGELPRHISPRDVSPLRRRHETRPSVVAITSTSPPPGLNAGFKAKQPPPKCLVPHRIKLPYLHAPVGMKVDAANGEVLVVSLTSGGPADRAGLSVGDVVVSINGRKVHTVGDVVEAKESFYNTLDNVMVVEVEGHIREDVEREIAEERMKAEERRQERRRELLGEHDPGMCTCTMCPTCLARPVKCTFMPPPPKQPQAAESQKTPSDGAASEGTVSENEVVI